jgi:hypothetical protein
MWTTLRAHLLDSDLERFGYLLAGAETGRDAAGEYVVVLRARYTLPLPDAALTVQTATRVEVSPDVTRLMLRTCYEHALSLVDVHTHPGSSAPATFSGQDHANALATHREFCATIPPAPPVFAASLVLTDTDVAGVWFDPWAGRLATLDRVDVVELVRPPGSRRVRESLGTFPITRPGRPGTGRTVAEHPPETSEAMP